MQKWTKSGYRNKSMSISHVFTTLSIQSCQRLLKRTRRSTQRCSRGEVVRCLLTNGGAAFICRPIVELLSYCRWLDGVLVTSLRSDVLVVGVLIFSLGQSRQVRWSISVGVLSRLSLRCHLNRALRIVCSRTILCSTTY